MAVIPENVGELRRYLETFDDKTRLVLINESGEELHFFADKADYITPVGSPNLLEPAVFLNVISESDWLISPMAKER